MKEMENNFLCTCVISIGKKIYKILNSHMVVRDKSALLTGI